MDNPYIKELYMIIESQYFKYLLIFFLAIYISFIQNRIVSNNTLFKNVYIKIISLLIIIFISQNNKILGLLLSILYILNIVSLNTEGLNLINDYENFTTSNYKHTEKIVKQKNISSNQNMIREITKTCNIIGKSCDNNNKEICKYLNRDIINIHNITKKMKKKINKHYIEMKDHQENINHKFDYSTQNKNSIESILKNKYF